MGKKSKEKGFWIKLTAEAVSVVAECNSLSQGLCLIPISRLMFNFDGVLRFILPHGAQQRGDGAHEYASPVYSAG